MSEIQKPSSKVVGWVYLIRCKANGRVYVGSSVRPDRRWYLHQHSLKAGKHHSPILQAAWNKYGPDAFRFELVQEVKGLGELLAEEQRWIDKFKDCRMNCAPVAGSPLGVLRTEEQRAKISATKRAFYATPEGRASIEAARAKKTGRVQSPEERAMRSARLKGRNMGRVWTEEARKKHSEALKGRRMPPVSDETRRKISEANKGRPAPANAIEAARQLHRNWIEAELPAWLAMRRQGMSFREIERITGRSRNVVARECKRAEQ